MHRNSHLSSKSYMSSNNTPLKTSKYGQSTSHMSKERSTFQHREKLHYQLAMQPRERDRESLSTPPSHEGRNSSKGIVIRCRTTKGQRPTQQHTKLFFPEDEGNAHPH
ncbi:hypothetical protein KC19_11G048800 [Ceratodon purpureus]|uniref:Uncharacterized protein n=1 Tax=Ceratodon purpureus TaxID=3225 RepID=A0A8T0GCB7_CERPU|nr:hypothetical protein KC19_11G048800 [Ceratodon purpureus]